MSFNAFIKFPFNTCLKIYCIGVTIQQKFTYHHFYLKYLLGHFLSLKVILCGSIAEQKEILWTFLKN